MRQTSPNRNTRKLRPFFALLAATGWLAGAPLGAEIACQIEQLTAAAPPFLAAFPAVDAAGESIAFHSDADLTGGNPDGSLEIFLWRRADGTVIQITDSPAAPSGFPDLPAAGDLVAFGSSGDFTGGNGDGNQEIFLYDLAGDAFTQLTDSSGSVFSAAANLSDDGTLVAFHTTADLDGTGNLDGLREVFLYDVGSGALTRVTDTAADSRDAYVSRDGTSVLFDSAADLTGGNADGSFELFSYHLATGVFTQLTDSAGNSGNAGFGIFLGAANSGQKTSLDGRRVVFHSSGDLTGGNADGSFEVFLFDRVTGAFTQLTDNVGFSATFPSIRGDGGLVYYHASDDPVGENPDHGFEIFAVEVGTGEISQLTVSDDFRGSFSPSVADGGRLVAFLSEANLTGGNPDASFETFFAGCSELLFGDGFESGDTGGWSVTLGALQPLGR